MFYHHFSSITITTEIDADWFYYLSKELTHTLTTYCKDLRVLKPLLLQSPSSLAHLLPQSLVTQTETLQQQLNSLMREKEIWEESRHGLEITNLTNRYFHNNEEAYVAYARELDEVLGSVDEDYEAYLPVDAVLTRPLMFCVYFLERVCLYCGCCCRDNNRTVGFTNNNNTNNRGFKAVGDTSLDPSITTKLHSTHLSINRILDHYEKSKLHLLTLIKVQELGREMDGFSGIVDKNTHQKPHQNQNYSHGNALRSVTGEFYRQGILLKLNKRKGLQNRIFFLFQNMLVYGTRLSSTQGFRLHGIILTKNLELLDTNLSSIPYSFSLLVKSGGESSSLQQQRVPSPSSQSSPLPNEKILILAAFTQHDHDGWICRLGDAIKRSCGDEVGSGMMMCRLMMMNNSSEEMLCGSGLGGRAIGGSNEVVCGGGSGSITHNRSNALSHVCWHRNISIDGIDVVEKGKHQISGPLLRKFKNSPGWQRLWVVFTHSTLYFYKNASETIPLASLPLLGYRIEMLSEEEKKEVVKKEHVFKLVFKAHVYYFRAESGFTFERWVRVLGVATNTNANAAMVTNS